MLPSYFDQTVIRIRPAIKSERGTPIPDWNSADHEPVSGCHVQPSSTSLNQDGRVLGIDDKCTLYAPPYSDIKAGDRLIIGNAEYTVIGEPKRWASPTGNLNNMQVQIERWSG